MEQSALNDPQNPLSEQNLDEEEIRQIARGFRDLMAEELIEAITPTLVLVKDEEMFESARNVVRQTFDSAENQDEYYYELAKKVLIMRRGFEENMSILNQEKNQKRAKLSNDGNISTESNKGNVSKQSESEEAVPARQSSQLPLRKPNNGTGIEKNLLKNQVSRGLDELDVMTVGVRVVERKVMEIIWLPTVFKGREWSDVEVRILYGGFHIRKIWKNHSADGSVIGSATMEIESCEAKSVEALERNSASKAIRLWDFDDEPKCRMNNVVHLLVFGLPKWERDNKIRKFFLAEYNAEEVEVFYDASSKLHGYAYVKLPIHEAIRLEQSKIYQASPLPTKDGREYSTLLPFELTLMEIPQ